MPFAGKRLKSLYIGGGTPSRLDDVSLTTLISGIQQRFGSADEVTLECNPEHVSHDRAALWQSIGITRVSLGIQSFDDPMLAFLGRAHSASQAQNAVQTILDAGIPEVSVDLIYGGNLCDDCRDPMRVWTDSLDKARASGAQHVSCYALTLEPHTPLATRASRGENILLEDELILQMMKCIPETLKMRQYEISNYACEDYFSAHNVSCWAGEPYLGLGPGAHSMVLEKNACIRSANLGNISAYLKDVDKLQKFLPPTEFVEKFSNQLHLAECLMCAARTRFQWSPSCIAARLKADLTPYRNGLARAEKQGLLQNLGDAMEPIFRTTDLGIQLNNCLDELLFDGAPET